ncbi:unnamed protein product [Meganyctiphanes norvegica]|uniref:Uncharacterized protein n=1 Tax=Meganyctiphanes norvegica TaxID=48144 RepID=A0AAV2SF57_MEGNR
MAMIFVNAFMSTLLKALAPQYWLHYSQIFPFICFLLLVKKEYWSDYDHTNSIAALKGHLYTCEALRQHNIYKFLCKHENLGRFRNCVGCDLYSNIIYIMESFTTDV